MKSLIGWAMLAGLLFTTAIAIIALVVLTIMNIADWLKMRKESECEFCELCREFYEGKKKECKGPEHCKDYNYFLAGKCAALEGQW